MGWLHFELKDPMRLIKRTIVYCIMALILVVIAILLGTLIWNVIELFADPSPIVQDKSGILHFFGYFMLVIIGIELLDTLTIYTKEQRIKVEIVLLVAMTAVAREMIVIDFSTLDLNATTLFGIAAVVIAIAGAYFLIKQAHSPKNNTEEIE